MKPTILPIIALLLCTTFSFAQINTTTPCTWMKGDNTVDQVGIYGTQGVAATANKPGARVFSTTWRDANGNLWLFGGMGYETTSMGYLNDLWKYTPSTNMWTWVKGDNTIEQYGVYGTQGNAAAANKPGATYASVSWTDASGNLWLFGGYGYSNNNYGFLNTLWKYNPATNQWTWIKGDKTIDEAGVYGTQGNAHSNNKPGARYGSQTWTDASGNLWLFGGYGHDRTATTGVLNDLWKYTPATNKWTWVKGDNTIDHAGVYGTQGIANATNKPGSRYVSSSWVDSTGHFWLFGGYGNDENNNVDNLNDLWKYNPATNEWTWMKGDKIIDQKGMYGTRGVVASTNKPGARNISNSWTDGNGDLWLFGGYGYDAASSGYLNDLWKYSPATNNWTWVKGDKMIDQTGVYGTQGMGSATNKSGARNGSVAWTDGLGNLWLFGGYGFDGNTSGSLNDLWVINNLMGVLPLHLLSFNGVLNNETVNLQWQTEEETNFSHFSIQRSFDGVNFTTIENINGKGANSSNQYAFPDNDLRNRSAQKVFYRLQLMNKDGSFTYSKVLLFDLGKKAISLQAFPNPATNAVTISFDQPKAGFVSISIHDMSGATVKKITENIAAGRASINIDINTLASGTYLIAIANQGVLSQLKIIKQ